ncbi:hypothetical protein Dimus_025574 [Dionaea muscipula]
MSAVSELKLSPKAAEVARKILGPAGNGTTVPEKTEGAKVKKQSANAKLQGRYPATTRSVLRKKPADSAVRRNASVDSSCSSESSSSSSAASAMTTESSRRRRRMAKGSVGVSSVKVVPDDGVEMAVPAVSLQMKRCDWITPHSDPLYISFHDQEWGVPVHDDHKLFELLVLSMALAEHTWTSILSKREMFRKLLDDFKPSTIAIFSVETLLSLNNTHGQPLLSEPKLLDIVDNAKQVLKIQEEFGSFSNYCWRFLNHRQMRNGFRYARQVPTKTPKAEYISKDLLRRGFRSVGPTVVYSFMQVSGMVNDHLTTCFRYNGCNTSPNEVNPSCIEAKEADQLTRVLETTRLL